MKGLVATTAVLGVLAIGGLPALALTLAAEETGPAEEPTTTLVEDVDESGRPGPPPWAQGRGPGEDRDDEDDRSDPADAADAADDAEGAPGWARKQDREPPPGWVRNHGGATPHGWAVREWAYCTAEAEGDREPGEQVDPDSACGDKPAAPGEAKKAPGAAQTPGGQGRSMAPGQQDRDESPGQAAKPDKVKKPKNG